MIVTFCGHAQFQKAKEYEQKTLDLLEEKIGDQAADIYLGNYGSFDDFAYNCCKKFKANHPNVSLIWVTPYIIINHDRDYVKYQQSRYDGILYPPIEDKPPRFAISYRNKYMVEKADYVIAYIEHEWGGAYQTYKYAKRKSKVIVNLANEPS